MKIYFKQNFNDLKNFAGNTLNDRNEQIDNKTNQWFGATVQSAGINGTLVVSINYFNV